jgi:nucleoside-specific outer membrane channel protein Tsx
MDRSSEEADQATPDYWFQDKYVQGSEHQTYWNNDYTLQRSYGVNQE